MIRLAAGFSITTEPGHEVVLQRDGQSIHPFEEVGVKAWQSHCAELGVADLPLGGREARPMVRDNRI